VVSTHERLRPHAARRAVVGWLDGLAAMRIYHGYVRWWSVCEAVSINRSALRQRGVPTIGSGGLLRDLVADGFVRYCCGPKAPCALLASCQGENSVDLVTIRVFTFPEAVEVA
jgi:hypothetical protein